MSTPSARLKGIKIGDLPMDAQRRIQSYILADSFDKDQPWYDVEDRGHDYSSDEEEAEHRKMRDELNDVLREEDAGEKEEVEGGKPGAAPKKEQRDAKIKKIKAALVKQEEGEYQNFLKEFREMNVNEFLGTEGKGETCLTLALKKKDLKLVKALLEAGASPDVSNESNEFPLVLTDNIVIAEMLVKAGANLKIRDKEGYSLLSKVLSNSDLYSEGGRIAFFDEYSDKRNDPQYLREFFMRSGMASLGVISLEIFNKELMKGKKRLIREYGSDPNKSEDEKLRKSDTWKKMLMLAPATEAELERRKQEIAMTALAESFLTTRKLEVKESKERKEKDEPRAGTLHGFERRKSADRGEPDETAKPRPKSPHEKKR